jgi:hypothetical protein
MFALPRQWAHDFVVAYEDKQITEEDGFKMTNSVVREVHISKVASKDYISAGGVVVRWVTRTYPGYYRLSFCHHTSM